MNEAFPQKIEKPWSGKTVEEQANFEGSWTNLMLERLRNLEIRKQVIDLLIEIEQTEKRYEDDGVYGIIDEPYVPRTREQIEKDFDEDMEMVARDTPITYETVDSFGKKLKPKFNVQIPGEREILPLNHIDEVFGKKLTEKEWNIVEAHEKGHVVRTYNFANSRKNGFSNSACLDEKFWKAFDFSKADYHDEYVKTKKEMINDGYVDIPPEEVLRTALLSRLMKPMELAERMSQLKNYFGMKGNERFTKEHLAFAKKHYLEDTGYNNNMTQFFQAITPEKEDTFIELINSAGI